MDKIIRKRLLKTFAHMKERCYDKSDKRYEDWGGRGIIICQEWLDDREKFVEWALNAGYELGLTIDRIDNDGNYCPENCRWVSISENNQNRRSSRYYTLYGKTQNLQQWCNEYNLSRSMVNKRLEMGWDFEKAITTPKKERDNNSLIGENYGRLTVISSSEKRRGRVTMWKCECDCGNIVYVEKYKLATGHTLSCGCLRKELAKERSKNEQQRK